MKLKTADFRILTRARSLESPTQLAGTIFAASRKLLAREINGTRYRLLGVGVSALTDAEDADPADLIDMGAERRAKAERAMDRVTESSATRPWSRDWRWMRRTRRRQAVTDRACY